MLCRTQGLHAGRGCADTCPAQAVASADCTAFCTIRRSASPEAWCVSQFFFANSSFSMEMNRFLFCRFVVAIEYYYGISVCVRYILSVLVDDASVCRAANPWDSLNECPSVQDVSTVFIWDIGLNIRSKKNPDGISKG